MIPEGQAVRANDDESVTFEALLAYVVRPVPLSFTVSCTVELEGETRLRIEQVGCTEKRAGRVEDRRIHQRFGQP